VGSVLDLARATNRFDVSKDVQQAMRIERNDLRLARKVSRDLLDIAESRRADVAQPLGQDQIRIRGPKRQGVHLIERATGIKAFSNHAARLPTRQALVSQEPAAHDGLRPRGRRMVALGRDANEILAEPQGVADLRGRRKKGNNSHVVRTSESPQPLKALFKDARRTCQGRMN